MGRPFVNLSVLSALVLGFVLVSCVTARTTGKDPIEIISATSQRWYGGTEESGWGINYTFKVVYDKTSDIRFDTMWIESRAYIPQLSPYELDSRKAIGPIDTISMFCKFHHSNDPGDGHAEHPPMSDGPEFNGSALLIYHLETTRLTYHVDSIGVLPALYYP
jgi:hypothetical protein